VGSWRPSAPPNVFLIGRLSARLAVRALPRQSPPRQRRHHQAGLRAGLPTVVVPFSAISFSGTVVADSGAGPNRSRSMNWTATARGIHFHAHPEVRMCRAGISASGETDSVKQIMQSLSPSAGARHDLRLRSGTRHRLA
jgi:hypothetical protein